MADIDVQCGQLSWWGALACAGSHRPRPFGLVPRPTAPLSGNPIRFWLRYRLWAQLYSRPYPHSPIQTQLGADR